MLNLDQTLELSESTLLRFIGACRLKQRCPVIRGIAFVEHTLEHCISVGLGAVGSQGGVVIYPSEDDDLGAAVISEEQAEAPVAELRPEPMLPGGTQRAALPILGSSRITRNCLEDQGAHSSQHLGIRRAGPAVRVFRLRLFDGRGQLLQLIEQQRVRVDGPIIDDNHESECNRPIDLLGQIDPDMLG
jgi:hypothetical protein